HEQQGAAQAGGGHGTLPVDAATALNRLVWREFSILSGALSRWRGVITQWESRCAERGAGRPARQAFVLSAGRGGMAMRQSSVFHLRAACQRSNAAKSSAARA